MASPGCVQLLPLCSTPRVATREGATGANAYLNALGLGIWFASGQTFSNPSSQGLQDRSRTYQGLTRPDTFTKGFSYGVPATCPTA